MASFSRQCRGVAFEIDGGLFHQKGGYGLEGHTEVYVLAVTDAALDTAAVIRGCIPIRQEDVVLFGASGGDASEAFAIFEALDGIDAQHGSAKGGVEFPELRRTQSCRTALDDTGDDASDSVAFSLDLGDEFFHLGGLLRIRTAHGVGLCPGEVVETVVAFQGNVAYL